MARIVVMPRFTRRGLNGVALHIIKITDTIPSLSSQSERPKNTLHWLGIC